MAWKLETDEEFTLTSDAGEVRVLPYRKVGELLMSLADHQGQLVDRQNLSLKLWPVSSSSVRLANLRQALTKLRQVVGNDNIISTRTSCGLSLAFRITIETSGDSSRNVKAIASSLFTFLEHLSERSPVQFFETLRVNVDSAFDLPSDPLLLMVDRASVLLPAQHPSHGWAHYLRGVGSIGNVPIARVHFAQSLRYAIDAQDQDLFQRSVHWSGACLILLGRVDTAVKLAHEAEKGAGQLRGYCRNWITSLKGTAYLHAGMFRESAEMMRQISYSDALSEEEWRQHEGLRAFYLATTGQFEEAVRVSEAIGGQSQGISFDRASVLAYLAQATVAARTEPSSITPSLQHWTSVAEIHGETHFLLYGLEALCLAQAQVGDTQGSLETLEKSTRVRESLETVKTRWDRHRLTSIEQIVRTVD